MGVQFGTATLTEQASWVISAVDTLHYTPMSKDVERILREVCRASSAAEGMQWKIKASHTSRLHR